jgi:hypothetical protein
MERIYLPIYDEPDDQSFTIYSTKRTLVAVSVFQLQAMTSDVANI